MTTSEFDYGDPADLQATFTDAYTSAAFNPDSVVFRYQSPSDSVSIVKTYGVDDAVTRPATGIYRCRVLLNAAGLWRWRVETPAQGVGEGRFRVRAKNIS